MVAPPKVPRAKVSGAKVPRAKVPRVKVVDKEETTLVQQIKDLFPSNKELLVATAQEMAKKPANVQAEVTKKHTTSWLLGVTAKTLLKSVNLSSAQSPIFITDDVKNSVNTIASSLASLHNFLIKFGTSSVIVNDTESNRAYMIVRMQEFAKGYDLSTAQAMVQITHLAGTWMLEKRSSSKKIQTNEPASLAQGVDCSVVTAEDFAKFVEEQSKTKNDDSAAEDQLPEQTSNLQIDEESSGQDNLETRSGPLNANERTRHHLNVRKGVFKHRKERRMADILKADG